MTEAIASPARVLHVGPIPPPTDGGIAAYLEGLLASPLSAHYELSTFDVRVPESSRRYRLLRWGTSVQFLSRFAWQLRRSPVDLVHIHTSAHLGFWEKSLMGLVAARAKTPYVLHMHGGDFDTFIRRLPRWQKRIAGGVLSRAGGVVVLSESWKPLFASWVEAPRLHVVANAVTLPRICRRVARQQGPVRILFVGMMSARKGLDELRQALTLLLQDDVRNFHVDLVGGEEFFGEAIRYRKLFRKHGLDDWVTFHGLKLGADREVFLQQADVSVLPSRSESFGIANLEAMAHGVPVISTRTGAIPEYITHGEQGLLFEPRDVDGLVRALRQLIEDAELRSRMGASARERAQRYDWKVLWQELDHVYRYALGSTR